LQLAGKIDLLPTQVCKNVTESGRIAPRMRQAIDQADADGITDADEYNGDRRCLTLRR
jgi:hypothetical protein